MRKCTVCREAGLLERELLPVGGTLKRIVRLYVVMFCHNVPHSLQIPAGGFMSKISSASHCLHLRDTSESSFQRFVTSFESDLYAFPAIRVPPK